MLSWKYFVAAGQMMMMRISIRGPGNLWCTYAKDGGKSSWRHLDISIWYYFATEERL
jgi:hypothetical protein